MPDFRAELRRRLAAARVEHTRKLEIIEEIAQDLEERQDELVARGVAPSDAEARVLAELDEKDTLARELARVEPPPRPVEPAGAPSRSALADLGNDLRYGVRALVKSPAFTIVTVASLALGIGANTAIFQLIDSLQLRELPVAQPGELADVKIKDRSWASGSFNGWHSDLTNPMWERIRDGQEGFAHILAWGDATFNQAPTGEVRTARGLYVSGDFFGTLQVPPALGRVFTAADDRRGCGLPGTVVSHAFWRNQLGADPRAVGRMLNLDGRDVEILGVSAEGFTGLEVGRSFDLAVPICSEPLFRGDQSRLDQRIGYWLSVVGRLKPGWTFARASAQLEAISPDLFAAVVPDYTPDGVEKFKAYRLTATPAASGISRLRADYSSSLYFLLGTSGLVLLIACANLANLLLARASRREREIAVRLALGASRGRLVRQLMTESLLLASIGAALGLWLSATLGRLLIGLISNRGASYHVDLSPDLRVLGFTVGLAVLTCLLFGLAPALRASRTEVGLVLKATGGHGATSARFGLRRLLVSIQVALSFVLLTGALLFSRSLGKLSSIETGFDEKNVIVFSADLRKQNLPVERRNAALEDLLERLRAVPGVVAAASASVVPLSGSGWNEHVSLEAKTAEEGVNTQFSRVSSDYFAAMDVPMVAGRDFGPQDKLGAPVVGVVNETFVEKLFDGRNPVGRTIYVSASSGAGPWTIDVIGVVKDTKYRSLREKQQPLMFVAAAQNDEPYPGMDTLVRYRGSLADTVAGLEQAAAAVPQLSIDIDTLDNLVRDSLQSDRMMATLSGFFGVLAALLATIGLYGVVAYSVARRTHEIGIRMALGAGRRTITAMILRETLVLLAIGLGAGIVLALAATQAAAGMLYGLAPHDPATYGLAVVLLAAVTLVASALPARRAASVDPTVALKEE